MCLGRWQSCPGAPAPSHTQPRTLLREGQGSSGPVQKGKEVGRGLETPSAASGNPGHCRLSWEGKADGLGALRVGPCPPGVCGGVCAGVGGVHHRKTGVSSKWESISLYQSCPGMVQAGRR